MSKMTTVQSTHHDHVETLQLQTAIGQYVARVERTDEKEVASVALTWTRGNSGSTLHVPVEAFEAITRWLRTLPSTWTSIRPVTDKDFER